MKKQKKHLDIKIFSKIVQELIKFKSGTTKLPIGGGSWEELIWATLVFMFGEDRVDWDPQSHEKSVDIKVKIDGDNFKISAKGAQIKKDLITMSSYRLTTFDDLTEQLKFIKTQHSNFDFYLICARKINEKEKNIVYYVIKVPSQKLSPKWLINKKNWIRTKNGYEVKNGFEFDAKIVSKMSKQLWYSIPFNYFSKGEIIVKLSVPFSALGRQLISFIKSRFD